MNATHWNKAREKRMRWSRSAVRAKAEIRRQRAEAIPEIGFVGDAAKIRAARPTWRINIERHDGQRVQITALAVHGKLLHGDTLETGRQLGRRIGVLLQEGSLT